MQVALNLGQALLQGVEVGGRDVRDLVLLSRRHYRFRPWQFLNFLPLPQGQGSLRPTLA